MDCVYNKEKLNSSWPLQMGVKRDKSLHDSSVIFGKENGSTNAVVLIVFFNRFMKTKMNIKICI